MSLFRSDFLVKKLLRHITSLLANARAQFVEEVELLGGKLIQLVFHAPNGRGGYVGYRFGRRWSLGGSLPEMRFAGIHVVVEGAVENAGIV